MIGPNRGGMSWRLVVQSPICLSALAGISMIFAQESEESPAAADIAKRAQKKAEVERVLADKARWRVFEQGNPIPKTRAEIPQPENTESPAAPQVVLSNEEMEALAAQAERYLSKPWVTDVLVATVFEDGFTEVEIVRNAKRVKALVNVHLARMHLPSIIETDTRIYQPLILVTKGESLADLRSRNQALLDAGWGGSLLYPLPDFADIPAADEKLAYVVGYDPSIPAGAPGDYETLDALLDHWERSAQQPAAQ